MSSHETSPRQRYQLGNYEIVETLGSGGMGIVYRANDLSLGRSVALKILRDDLRAQPHIVARFQREAEAIATLDHPNIVHVHNVGRVGKIPFIAMEHIDGHTLGDLLRDGEKLAWRDVLQLGRQIAAALAAAHAAHIIHRDIKPGNILLDHTGRAYVTDFGIAKIMTAVTHLTVDGSRLGTPQYMCPERCKNRPITPASDLYSLGVVLFQAVAGRLPHEANSNVELVRKITGEAPPRLRFLVPEVPEDVERLIAFLLERDPTNRPQRAEEVIAAIDRILEGKPLDERHNLAMNAIAAYRDEMSTPTPSSGSEESHERLPLGARVREGWFALRIRTRVGIAAIMMSVLIAGGLLGIVSIFARPAVAPPDYGPDGGIHAWTDLPVIGVVRDEAPGVRVVRPNLTNFTVAEIHSAAPNDEVLLRMTDMASGTNALFSLDAALGALGVVMPPRALGVDTPQAVYAADSHWFAATASGMYRVSNTDDNDAQLLWDAPVSAWAPLPGDAGSLVASPSMSGGYNLLLLPKATMDAPEHLTELSGAIRWIEVSPSSGAAYFAEESVGGFILWRLSLDGHAVTPKKIVSGVTALGAQPLDTTRDRLVVLRGAAPGQVDVIDGFSGAVLAELGEGAAPSWTHRADNVVLLSTDHADRRQLWRVQLRDASRRQLTHLDAGIGDRFAVTRGHAVATNADGTALIVADL